METVFIPSVETAGKHITFSDNNNEPMDQEVLPSHSVGEIAAKDHRKIKTFEKYGIDFCCGGKKTVGEICEEKGLSLLTMLEELNRIEDTSEATLNYTSWDPTFLADYIFNQHHKFFYNEDAEIKDLLQKVFDYHSGTHLFLREMRKAYLQLAKELYIHFIKEEQIVFPFIETLEQVKLTGKIDLLDNITPLARPLHMMETDHDEAGKGLRTLRRLTNGYVPPLDACNSFRLLYKKLEALEADLHLHIHLENNILFPAAIKLEKAVRHISQLPIKIHI